MRRSDILFLIIGTNPMPNVISIVNRVKADGMVFLIHSVENSNGFGTDKIANEIKKLINEKFPKMKLEPIVVDKLSENSMKSEVKNRIEKYNLENDSNKVFELNYTGGTKLMSSTIYSYFKGKVRAGNENIILSYLDCERDLFVYEVGDGKEIKTIEKSLNEVTLNDKISLKDIIACHGLKYYKDNSELKYKHIANDIYSKFELLNVEEKYKWLKELNDVYFYYKKKENKEDIEKLISFVNKYSTHDEVEELKLLSIKKAVGYVTGESLEEYVFQILQLLKKERKIDDYVWSYEQQANEKSGIAGIEIDFVIIKDTKNFLLSVTLCEDEEPCKVKLIEAKTRAEQLAGDETRVGFMCLYSSIEELKELLDGNNEYSKNLVIGIENFMNIEEQLINWVEGGR